MNIKLCFLPREQAMDGSACKKAIFAGISASHMNEWVNEKWVREWMSEWMRNGWVYEWISEWVNEKWVSAWVNEWEMGEWVNEWVRNGWVSSEKWVSEWMNEWVSKWVRNGWVSEWVSEFIFCAEMLLPTSFYSCFSYLRALNSMPHPWRNYSQAPDKIRTPPHSLCQPLLPLPNMQYHCSWQQRGTRPVCEEAEWGSLRGRPPKSGCLGSNLCFIYCLRALWPWTSYLTSLCSTLPARWGLADLAHQRPLVTIRESSLVKWLVQEGASKHTCWVNASLYCSDWGVVEGSMGLAGKSQPAGGESGGNEGEWAWAFYFWPHCAASRLPR